MITAWDCETHLIKPGMLAPRLVCLSWMRQDGASDVLHREEALSFMRRMLGNRDAGLLVGHNIVFDLGVLCAEDSKLLELVFQAYEDGRIRCTKIRQQLINIALGELKWRRVNGETTKSEYSLASLIERYFKERLEKKDTWRLKYALLDKVPVSMWPSDAVLYAADDAKATLRVYLAQEAVIKEIFSVALPNELEQLKAAWALHLMSLWGVRTDEQAVEKFHQEMTAEQTEVHRKLLGTGIFREDGSKNLTEIRRRVEESLTRLNKPIDKTAKTKQVSTSEEVLKQTDDKDLLLLAKSLTGAKHLGTWGPTLRDGVKWPICAGYNVLVETGRTSCGSPNMQNPPRSGGVRETFIARPGYLFCSVDYDTIELRALGQVCLDILGESKMAEALRRGDDLHLLLAADILGLSSQEIKERYLSGDMEVENTRQISKIANFGLPGGLAASTFVDYAAGYGVVVSQDFAERLVCAWHTAFPEMKKYFDYVSNLVGGYEGEVVQVRSKRRRGGVSFCSAANSFFQGLTADGVKEALWQVARDSYLDSSSPLFGARSVIFLHDEIIMELPEIQADAAARRQAVLMMEAMSKWIPDVPITAKPVLMRRWYKGAKPLEIDGKLVPVRPHVVGNAITWIYDEQNLPKQKLPFVDNTVYSPVDSF